MAIAFDNTNFYQNNGATGAVVTGSSWTIASGGSLVVFAQYEGDAQTVTAVRWRPSGSGNEPCTQVLATTDDSGGGLLSRNSIWMLNNPTSGAGTVEVTYSATGTAYQSFAAISYTGVSNATVSAMWQATAHGKDTGTVSVTSTAGDLAVSCICYFKVTLNPSQGAGMTLRGAVTQVGAGGYYIAMEDKVATAGSTTTPWTTDGFDTSTIVSVSLVTGGGGGGSRPVKMAGAWGGFAGSSGGFAG